MTMVETKEMKDVIFNYHYILKDLKYYTSTYTRMLDLELFEREPVCLLWEWIRKVYYRHILRNPRAYCSLIMGMHINTRDPLLYTAAREIAGYVDPLPVSTIHITYAPYTAAEYSQDVLATFIFTTTHNVGANDKYLIGGYNNSLLFQTAHCVDLNRICDWLVECPKAIPKDVTRLSVKQALELSNKWHDAENVKRDLITLATRPRGDRFEIMHGDDEHKECKVFILKDLEALNFESAYMHNCLDGSYYAYGHLRGECIIMHFSLGGSNRASVEIRVVLRMDVKDTPDHFEFSVIQMEGPCGNVVSKELYKATKALLSSNDAITSALIAHANKYVATQLNHCDWPIRIING